MLQFECKIIKDILKIKYAIIKNKGFISSEIKPLFFIIEKVYLATSFLSLRRLISFSISTVIGAAMNTDE